MTMKIFKIFLTVFLAAFFAFIVFFAAFIVKKCCFPPAQMEGPPYIRMETFTQNMVELSIFWDSHSWAAFLPPEKVKDYDISRASGIFEKRVYRPMPMDTPGGMLSSLLKSKHEYNSQYTVTSFVLMCKDDEGRGDHVIQMPDIFNLEDGGWKLKILEPNLAKLLSKKKILMKGIVGPDLPGTEYRFKLSRPNVKSEVLEFRIENPSFTYRDDYYAYRICVVPFEKE